MYIHIHILSDIVQRFKVKKIHVDLLFVPVEIKDHFSFQISQKMKLSNDPGKVESNFFCYAAIRITYLRIWLACPSRGFSESIGIWKCWFLRRGENRSTRRKTSRSKDENQQQTTNWQCAFPHIRMFSFLHRECIKAVYVIKYIWTPFWKGVFSLKDFVQSLELQTIAKKSLQFYMFRT